MSSKEIRQEAVAEFVSQMSAAYRKHTGEAVREDMIAACILFDINPEVWFTDPEEALELRALVAYHKVRGTYDEALADMKKRGVFLETTATYDEAKPRIEASIRMGIAAEEDWSGPSVKPGELSDDQITWLASWLAGDGVR